MMTAPGSDPLQDRRAGCRFTGPWGSSEVYTQFPECVGATCRLLICGVVALVISISPPVGMSRNHIEGARAYCFWERGHWDGHDESG